MNSWQIPCPGASQVAVRVKTLRASAGDGGVHPWVRKMPWRRAQRSTPVFLPGKFHGQKSLSGFSPVGRKELGMTEVTLTRAPHSWPFLCFIPFLTFLLASCLLLLFPHHSQQLCIFLNASSLPLPISPKPMGEVWYLSQPFSFCACTLPHPTLFSVCTSLKPRFQRRPRHIDPST